MSVSFSLLVVGALLGAAGAGLVAALRRLGWMRVRREAGLAGFVAAASVAAGIGCYALGTRVVDDVACRNAGAACFAMFPLLSVAVLRVAARRRGWRIGSTMAGVVLGLAAVVLTGVWVTLVWMGPRGGWQMVDLFAFFGCVVILYSAAVCLGWWSGRGIG